MPQPVKFSPSGIQYKPKILIQERPEHAARIGSVAAEWVALEDHLINITAFGLFGMTNLDARGVVETALYAIENQRRRLEFIKDLLIKRTISPALYKIFEDNLKPEIEKRASERNRIMHAHWGIMKEFPDDIILMSPTNEHQRYSIKDLEDIADRIIETSNNIARFMLQLAIKIPESKSR